MLTKPTGTPTGKTNVKMIDHVLEKLLEARGQGSRMSDLSQLPLSPRSWQLNVLTTTFDTKGYMRKMNASDAK
jgi:hypothetical protein